ncbi:Mth938-like domain-containing protein [Luteimonas dalianensis]|uniref:Mth938-like domain-containing protein n=1 Tax=Luteimonas dalianensis TaxID=1148196 RepID=UPI003BEFB283
MELHLDKPDYEFFLRSADGASALVNERRLQHSFVIAPDTLVEDWPVRDAAALGTADLEAILALKPELVLLGTGARQVFPSAEVMAACLSRGIGLESMANDSAARTYHVLAGEGRRVVAGFIFPAA